MLKLSEFVQVETPSSAGANSFTIAEQAEIDSFYTEHGSGVKAVINERRDTLLHEAAMKGMIAVVKFLVFQGADVNAKNRYGYTPLFYAALGTRSITTMKFLIDTGADVNAKAEYDTTPLHEAARYKNLQN